MVSLKRRIVRSLAIGVTVLATHGAVSAQERKLCDLGEPLQQPERIAEFVDCSVFTVQVLNRPVACGLYDKLSRRMKSGWVSAVRRICRESESCVDLMAECAARPISGGDLQGASSSSDQSLSSSSQVTSSSSSQSTSSTSHTYSSSSSSQASSTGAQVIVPPVTGSSSSADSGGSYSSSAGTTTKVPVQRGSRPQPNLELRRVPSSQRMPVSPASGGASSSPQSEDASCYVCLYDEQQPDMAEECAFRGNNARQRGVLHVIVKGLSEALTSGDRAEMCACRNVDVIVASHGYPGQEHVPFKEVSKIVDIAPRCSTINVDNWRCSSINNEKEAQKYAEELSVRLATSGYTGKVTIKGYQTVHWQIHQSTEVKNRQDEWSIIERIAESPTQRARMKLEYLLDSASDMLVCDYLNTPLEFQVCPSEVKLALSPCKAPGSVSILDKAHGADQSILCQKDGLRASQSCAYIDLSKVVDVKLPGRRNLRKYLSDGGFKDNGCDLGGSCLCQWKEAVTCE